MSEKEYNSMLEIRSKNVGDNGDAYHGTNGNAMNINIYQVALIAYIHTYTPTYLSCELLFTEDELILHRNE